MNYKYYKSSSINEELFGIYNTNTDKFFLLNEKNECLTVVSNKVLQGRLNEIQPFEYYFSENILNYIINKIEKYIQCCDMTYRGKTLKCLLKDIEELKKIKAGE